MPLITGDLEPEIYACLRAKSESLNCQCLAVGGIENHVHLLVRLHRTLAVAQLAKHLKGASSHLATQRCGKNSVFKWQGGYGALSVSVSHIKRVTGYIANQKEHHAEGKTWPHLESIDATSD